MAKLNRNLLAKEVAVLEGLKTGVSIAQIKEVLRVIFTKYTLEQTVEHWQAYNK
jgi:hypothetical protein